MSGRFDRIALEMRILRLIIYFKIMLAKLENITYSTDQVKTAAAELTVAKKNQPIPA